MTHSVRRFLVPAWRAWHLASGSPKKHTLSQGYCDRSSLFLSQVLQADGFAAQYAAGDPTQGPKGFFHHRVWKGHAWVECQGLILDVTADQFDGPPVLITSIRDPRYRRGTDSTTADFLALRQQMVAGLMEDWQLRLPHRSMVAAE